MLKKICLSILLAITFLSTAFQCQSKSKKDRIDKRTVQNFDINRYLGQWYEIARYPHSFEKDLVGVTATYTLKANGTIEVINKGRVKTLDGETKIAVGKAKPTDVTGKLKVSFFLFFYADYNILELDEVNYQWALVGSSTPGYLWILSRNANMPDKLYTEILSKASKRGYDLAKLYMVPQK